MKRLTCAQLRKACEEHEYLLLTFDTGYKMAVNSKVSTIALAKKNYVGNRRTQFIGFQPCNFNEYITNKHPFI